MLRYIAILVVLVVLVVGATMVLCSMVDSDDLSNTSTLVQASEDITETGHEFSNVLNGLNCTLGLDACIE